MFSLAVRWGMRETNPCKGIERNKEHHRRRYLSGDELGRLVAALADHPDRQAADAVRLLLLTGARRGEVLGMRWGGHRSHGGHVVEAAVEHQAERNTTRCRCPHRPARCWPASARSKPRTRNARSASSSFHRRARPATSSRSRKAWATLIKAAGIENLRLHDLRHCYASALVSSGASLPLIGAMLGHASPATTARYSHMFADPQRAAAEKIGVLIENAAVQDSPPDNVVPLGRGRS